MGRIFTPPRTTSRRRALRAAPTSAESFLWKHIRRRHIAGCKFRRQHGIGPFIVDFFAPEVGLVIELDGEVHDDPDQSAYDRSRQQYIERFGINVLRFRNDELFAFTSRVLALIEREVLRLRVEKGESTHPQ